jgi:hypothetical protein
LHKLVVVTDQLLNFKDATAFCAYQIKIVHRYPRGIEALACADKLTASDTEQLNDAFRRRNLRDNCLVIVARHEKEKCRL